MAEKSNGLDELKGAGQDLLRNLGDKALDTVNDKISGLTDRLSDVGEGGGGLASVLGKAGEASAEGKNPLWGGIKGAASEVKDKVTGGGSSGGGGGGKATKSTNIIETIDVGVPLTVAYNQWTEFGAFPSFMKKVENVEAQEDNKLKFKAQIFLSHRTWEATILEQVPDERIVWRSQGEKGHVDGAVTFHELAPNLTRILVVLEYYPQGLFEKTGNLWRAQGRRARAELRHFRRHVMTRTILEPDEVEGWRGVIEDGEVVESHEEHVEQEEQEQEEQGDSEETGEEPEDEAGDEPGDEAGDEAGDEEGDDAAEEEDYEDEPVDEDEEYEDEPVDEDAEEEYEDEPVDEEEEYDDELEDEPADEELEDEPVDEDEEYEEEEEEEKPHRRRRAS